MSDMPSPAHFALRTAHCPSAPEQAGSCGAGAYGSQRAHERVLRHRLRRRAGLDALLVLLATSGASLWGEHSADRLLAGIFTLSLGILAFVMRRGGDVARLAQAGRWREEAVAGRGLTLSQWHAGVPLARWAERPAAHTRCRAEEGAEKADETAKHQTENSDSPDSAR